MTDPAPPPTASSSSAPPAEPPSAAPAVDDPPTPLADPGADPAPYYAIGSGIALLLVGAVGYTLSDDGSVTALIPAGVGALLIVCGLVARTSASALKHAMHAAAVVGLLGFLAAAGRLAMVLARGGGSTLGVASLAAMAVICAVFVGLCVKSFRDARKRREAA